MSADNWSICPRCKAQNERAYAQAQERLASAYGEVSETDYLAIKAVVEAGLPAPDDTLREDYGIGTDELGVFRAYYRARCTVCSFKHEFEHQEVLLPR